MSSENQCKPEFHGLIQHSFALQLTDAHASFPDSTAHHLVSERFGLRADVQRKKQSEHQKSMEFRVAETGAKADTDTRRRCASHSPLVEVEGRTSIGVREPAYLKPGPANKLPDALTWAVDTCKDGDGDLYKEPRLILARPVERNEQAACNDFLIRCGAESSLDLRAVEISTALLEVIAHKRSRLFGLALGNRFVNVMLPHAILTDETAENRVWLLQPLVTLICGARRAATVRSTYALSIFLLPVKPPARRVGSNLGTRRMCRQELQKMVNAGWGLAAAPLESSLPLFQITGPLRDYMLRLASPDLNGLWEQKCSPTLRRLVEWVAYGVSLRMSQGSRLQARRTIKKQIGDDVITALGSARVSSLVVVDEELTKGSARVRDNVQSAPGNLVSLMDELSADSRVPKGADWTRRDRNKYRLDRPFLDGDEAAVGVLPHGRCLIVASARDAQCGRLESALMQAGSVAYMTLGAATAIGMLRSIDRDLEKLGGANPTKIAEIDAEIATDLNDIYDLDITRESYRRLYRRLRNRLGITSDYQTLQDKMKSLYQAASTKNLQKTNWLLIALTAVAVVFALIQVFKG